MKPKGYWAEEPSKAYLLYVLIFAIPTWLVELVTTNLLHWPMWIPWVALLAFTAWAHEVGTDSGFRSAWRAKRAYEGAQRTLRLLERARLELEVAERSCVAPSEPADGSAQR